MKKLVTWTLVFAIVVGSFGGLFNPSSRFRRLVGQYVPGLSRSSEPAPDRIQDFAYQLENNLQSFGQMREKVQAQLTEHGRIHRERDNELLGVQSLLARFKEEYAVGVGPGGFPRQILGRSYSKESLEAQVELLLKRRNELDQVASHYTTLIEKLQRSKSELDQRIGTTKTHLDSMPLYVTLVESHALTDQADQAITGLESCLAANDAVLEATVRNATDLLQQAQDEQHAANQAINVREFLQSESVVPSPAGKTPSPTVPNELPNGIKAFLETQSVTATN